MKTAGPTEGQVLGCILGGALGDAWGGPWEGHIGPLLFEIPLQSRISDDTQLTLATCESVTEKGSVDPENLAAHFLDWFVRGRITGIGASTLKAMRNLSAEYTGRLPETMESTLLVTGPQCGLLRWHLC